MARFKLAFGIHNHQPVGNFEAVFDQAQREAYRPFSELLRDFPSIRISLHQSGILWRWQEHADPDSFVTIGKMVDRGQIELMTGGFYEPILPSIPEKDAIGQITMLSDYIFDHFQVKAEGLWLTERIWEPHLPKLLARSKVKYLPVDDTHFYYAGLESEQLSGPFVTESEGYRVRLLPIQKRLRYLIPFGTVEEIIAHLRAAAEKDPDGMLVYADDGEKFGVWPETHRHCYRDGWLREFLEALEQNSDWLEVIPLGEAADLPSAGRVYLPSASYAEMLHWALPSKAGYEYEQFEKWLEESGNLDRFGRFVRGGHWRGFLAKYDEANLMHKKMQTISRRLATFETANPEKDDLIRPVKERLYAAQCNCSYWHGVFGGLYLPHLRQAINSNLAEAEAFLNKAEGIESIKFAEIDFDADGNNEIVVTGPEISAIVKPSKGGILLDYALPKMRFDLTDTLSRRREAYHYKLDEAVTNGDQGGTASIHDLVLAKEPGLKDYLVEDWYLKRCFIDHFLDEDLTLSDFAANRYDDRGDFVLEPYEYNLDAANRTIVMKRRGFVRDGELRIPVTIKKICSFADDASTIRIVYELSSENTESATLNFGVENNFSFQAGHAEDRYLVIDGVRPSPSYLDSMGEQMGSLSGGLVDEFRNMAVVVASDQGADIWYHPIFTVSLSEGGFERVYQGTTMLHRFKLAIGKEPCRIEFVLRAGSISEVIESVHPDRTGNTAR